MTPFEDDLAQLAQNSAGPKQAELERAKQNVIDFVASMRKHGCPPEPLYEVVSSTRIAKGHPKSLLRARKSTVVQHRVEIRAHGWVWEASSIDGYPIDSGRVITPDGTSRGSSSPTASRQ